MGRSDGAWRGWIASPVSKKEIVMFGFVVHILGHDYKWIGRKPDRRYCCGTQAQELAVIAFTVSMLIALADRATEAAQPPTSPPARFLAESRESLKKLQFQMAALGAQVLDGLETEEPTKGELASQALTVSSAKAGYDCAVLVQQSAVLALKEYIEGTFPGAKTDCQTEIELAEAERESADRAVKPALERYEKLKKFDEDSVADLAVRWQLEAFAQSAVLQQKQTMLRVEVARSKLKVLLGYEKSKNEKELMSNVAKAKSSELAWRATWEIGQPKLKKLQSPNRSGGRLSDDRKRFLTVLDQASAIEGRLSTRLTEQKPESRPDDAAEKEIADLIRQLRGLVDQAQDEEDAAALTRLKAQLMRTSGR
jgi:hypothetical protein